VIAMPAGRPTGTVKLATAATVESLLRGLQDDIERFGSAAVKQRRRAILKGFRAGFWAATGKPTQADVALTLRAELFGHPLPVVSAEVDESEWVSTMNEDAQWLMAMESGPRAAPEED
jgi:hypothetical protein